jgi:hypothetical protein
MPVDQADVAQVRKIMVALPQGEADELGELQTIPEVLAYTIALARAEGRDELQAVELVVRAADLSRNERRSAATVLRKLGYVRVAGMLRSFKAKSGCT